MLCLARFNKYEASALAVISLTENEEGIFSKLILKTCFSVCEMKELIASTIDVQLVGVPLNPNNLLNISVLIKSAILPINEV